MHLVKPSVFLIASTEIDEDGMAEYLKFLGVPDWQTDAPSGAEELIEVQSRGCYMSFGTELNPNLTQVRDGNLAHLANVVKQGHGSVLEHASASWVFGNVSRVLTHELVRHRVGTAISQQSLRFVRLTDLGGWIPSVFANNPEAVVVYERAWRQAEDNYQALLSEQILGFDIDNMVEGLEKTLKKELTSAARRLAPIGLATNIGWTCNMRTLRYVLEQRTHPDAEEEIRIVFAQVGAIALERWPHLFSDYEVMDINGIPCYHTDNRKI